MEINIKNLLRAIALMETIPEDRINMKQFRGDMEKPFTHVCGSTGCVIGFSTALDTEENLERFNTSSSPRELSFFKYDEWSREFFSLDNDNSKIWAFMFSGCWENNKAQIIKRMQWVADGKELPESFAKTGRYRDSLYNYEVTLP